MFIEKELITTATPGFNLPAMWGRFTYRVEGIIDVQEINLIKLYQMAKEMTSIDHLRTGARAQEAWITLCTVHNWLESFLEETKNLPIPKTHEALARLHQQVTKVNKRVFDDSIAEREAPLTLSENSDIREALLEFEKEFEHESRQIAVFGVTPKDDRDLRILIDDAIKNWPADVLAALPDKTKYDLREAGRCLAFERPTACALHICRATEALMLGYYEKLATQPWPHAQKDWGIYNRELIALNAPERITTRLDEIRKMDRNAYAHPDITVPLDEAPIIYGLCRNVIFLMAKEMI